MATMATRFHHYYHPLRYYFHCSRRYYYHRLH